MFEKQQTRVHGFYEMYTYLSLLPERMWSSWLDQTWHKNPKKKLRLRNNRRTFPGVGMFWVLQKQLESSIEIASRSHCQELIWKCEIQTSLKEIIIWKCREIFTALLGNSAILLDIHTIIQWNWCEDFWQQKYHHPIKYKNCECESVKKRIVSCTDLIDIARVQSYLKI